MAAKQSAGIALLLVGALVLALTIRPTQSVSYKGTPLGTLGTKYSCAYAINNAGQVVGTCGAPGFCRAFVWTNGKMTSLSGPDIVVSEARDINEAGQIVGMQMDARGKCLAVLWEKGKSRTLGALGGEHSFAYAINNRGQVVGRAQTSREKAHAFLWSAGKMTDLGTLGGDFSIAYSINDRGQVVGVSKDASGHNRAFLWERGRMYDLGTLGGLQSCALHINADGLVVGHSLTPDRDLHACLFAYGRNYDLSSVSEIDGKATTITPQGEIYCLTGNGSIETFNASDVLHSRQQHPHRFRYTGLSSWQAQVTNGNGRGRLVGQRVTSAREEFRSEAVLLTPP